MSGDTTVTTAHTNLQSSIDDSFQEVVSSGQRGRRQTKTIEKEKKQEDWVTKKFAKTPELSSTNSQASNQESANGTFKEPKFSQNGKKSKNAN